MNWFDRVKILEDGVREGLTCLRVHRRKHQGKACLLENKVLLSKLIDEYLKDHSPSGCVAAALSAAKVGPPAIENKPPVVTPTWPTLSYIKGGGGNGSTSAPGGRDGLRAFLQFWVQPYFRRHDPQEAQYEH